MTFAQARLTGIATAIFQLRENSLPSRVAHQAFIDLSSSLFASAHGIRYIRSARNHVAPGVEARSTGFQRESVNLDRSLFLQFQTRCPAEIKIEGLSNGQNYGVAFKALYFICGNRASPS